MKLVYIALAFSLASPAFAATSKKCENYAKFGAARAFKAEIRDSQELSFRTSLERTDGDRLKYNVLVESPCTVDGDDSNCSMSYDVVVKALDARGTRCAVVSVRKAGN